MRTRSTRIIAIVAVCLVFAASRLPIPAVAATAFVPWPMLGHDARHTGRTLLIGPQTAAIAWVASAGLYHGYAPANSAPVVGADGAIYITTQFHRLLAFEPSGRLRWSLTLDAIVSDNTPAIGSDGTIYIGGNTGDFPIESGALYAVSPEGTVLWTVSTDGLVGSATIGPDSTIYVPARKAGLYAIGPDGAVKWRFPDCALTSCSISVSNPPAVGLDGTVYFGDGGGCVDSVCDPGHVYAVNPDGSGRWRFYIGDERVFAPSIGADGTLYVIAGGRLMAFRPSGIVKWTINPNAQFGFVDGHGLALGADGSIYAPVARGTPGPWSGVLAVSPLGVARWVALLPEGLLSAPTVGGDGTLYVSGQVFNGSSHYVRALRPNGTTKWHRRLPDGIPLTPPTIAPGRRLYVNTQQSAPGRGNYLYAFGIN